MLSLKLKSVKIFVLMSMICSSCISPSIMDPSLNSLKSGKLPQLEIGIEEENVQRDASSKSITSQDAFTTVIQREFQKNVIMLDTISYGYLESKITYDKTQNTFLGICTGILTCPTALIFYGAPVTLHKREIQIEFNIYDSKKRLVKNYIYTAAKKNYPIFLYTPKKFKPNNIDYKKGIVLLKVILEDFKKDLDQDFGSIQDRLKSTGAINK
jgi:hypothetical protein